MKQPSHHPICWQWHSPGIGRGNPLGSVPSFPAVGHHWRELSRILEGWCGRHWLAPHCSLKSSSTQSCFLPFLKMLPLKASQMYLLHVKFPHTVCSRELRRAVPSDSHVNRLWLKGHQLGGCWKILMSERLCSDGWGEQSLSEAPKEKAPLSLLGEAVHRTRRGAVVAVGNAPALPCALDGFWGGAKSSTQQTALPWGHPQDCLSHDPQGTPCPWDAPGFGLEVELRNLYYIDIYFTHWWNHCNRLIVCNIKLITYLNLSS